jgi:type II secretory pathway component PulK
MGVAFAFSMHLETQATRQFVATAQARYVAEAGIAHARALLDEDRLGSRIDAATEAWGQSTEPREADIDGDRTPEAPWRPVADAAGGEAGRYAWLITDEAGKANLNVAQADPAPLSLGAINLTILLQQAGITEAQATAQAIERYRYGPDTRPGQGGVDDDADGSIDELDEYRPLALLGDDRRLESLEDLVGIVGLEAEEVRRLAALATVYSWDVNVSVMGQARMNVNTATAEELLSVLLQAGVRDPWSAAVNMADYVDRDLAISRVTKAAQLFTMDDEGPLGGWEWKSQPEGHYASAGPGGEGLSWLVELPAGTFRVLARGLEGVKVGDVTLAGQFLASVNDSESLGVFTLGGAVEVRVVNREAAGTPCAFRGIELVSESGASGVLVRGVEAVRFNEVMVEPVASYDVSSATFDAQGSDWGCPLGAPACSNGGVGQARWSWTDSALLPGRYHVRVFGTASGQTVGDVRVDGNAARLVHGQRHPSTLLVGSDGKISLTVGKSDSEGTYYLKGITLFLQPDGEYVELINLSDAELDVGGWTIEGEATGGRQARLPTGSRIAPHGLLLAAVDLDDNQQGLAGNGIDGRSAWEVAASVRAVQLEFPAGAPSPDDDWLKVSLAAGTPARLVLRTAAGSVVDEVEYPLPLPLTAKFQSVEKGDPTVVSDTDLDGLDEGWFPSLQLYTPGAGNDNAGLKETVGLETIVHDPAKEIALLNRPLGGVGELAGLPSGKAWRPFSSEDLANIVDRLTVEGLRLETERHLVEELDGEGAWREEAEGYYLHTDPEQADVIGRWEWTGLSDGRYRLSLYGCDDCSGEQFSVRWEQVDGTPTAWSPPLSSDAQGRIVIGQLNVGLGGTPTGILRLDVRCVSPGGICHLDHVRLDPQLIRIGPVNVNTAPLGVLRALPGMTDALAGRLIAGRPYGDQDHKGRGIGDLLLAETLASDEAGKLSVFRQVGHLLTTRSDVFQIVSLGQALDEDRPTASQRIQTIVQR